MTKRADGQEHWVLAQPKHLKKVDLTARALIVVDCRRSWNRRLHEVEVVTLFHLDDRRSALEFGIVARAVARGC